MTLDHSSPIGQILMAMIPGKSVTGMDLAGAEEASFLNLELYLIYYHSANYLK